MQFGTAQQDALRRDFTINSMFYNLNDACVEDLTGKGMEDLRAGVIRAPLPPSETFKDGAYCARQRMRAVERFIEHFCACRFAVATRTSADLPPPPLLFLTHFPRFPRNRRPSARAARRALRDAIRIPAGGEPGGGGRQRAGTKTVRGVDEGWGGIGRVARRSRFSARVPSGVRFPAPVFSKTRLLLLVGETLQSFLSGQSCIPMFFTISAAAAQSQLQTIFFRRSAKPSPQASPPALLSRPVYASAAAGTRTARYSSMYAMCQSPPPESARISSLFLGTNVSSSNSTQLSSLCFTHAV